MVKQGQEKVYILCNDSWFVSSLVKILLFKLKYLYILYAWISIMKKLNSNQNMKVEKMVVLVKTFDYYHHTSQLFHLSCKIAKEFETEIAVWKALYNFKIKRTQEARHNKFFILNVENNDIFETFKMFKNNS